MKRRAPRRLEGEAAMEDGGGVPGQGESSALALREEGKRSNRTWLRWVVKRRRDSSSRRRMVVPVTRRRGDGVATGMKEMVARAVL